MVLTTSFDGDGDGDGGLGDRLLACRERWGISYYVVRDIESFAPVIDALGHEDRS